MQQQPAFSHPQPGAEPPAVHDPVLDALLDQGIVTYWQVQEARTLRRQMYREGDLQPVWRWLAWTAGIDRDAVYRIAAEVIGYPRIDTRPELLKGFIRRIAPCFSAGQWRRMAELCITPVKGRPGLHRPGQWCFAAHDPTSKHVHDFLHQCAGPEYTLYQADRAWIGALISEAVLSKMELPRANRLRRGLDTGLTP